MQTPAHNFQTVEAAMDGMRRAMAGARERLGEGLDLTRTQIEILMMLNGAPQTTGELAKRLYLTQSAVTQTIETLSRRGLIERRPDEHDRRVTQLQLSPQGRGVTQHVRSLKHEFMRSFVQRLSQEEIITLISITDKLTAQINETKSKEI